MIINHLGPYIAYKTLKPPLAFVCPKASPLSGRSRPERFCRSAWAFCRSGYLAPNIPGPCCDIIHTGALLMRIFLWGIFCNKPTKEPLKIQLSTTEDVILFYVLRPLSRRGLRSLDLGEIGRCSGFCRRQRLVFRIC